MQRIVERELLDDLPAHCADAMQSRRDLVRVNAWMGNARIAAAEIPRLLPGRRTLRMADLGGGDGLFLARVIQLLSARGISGEAVVVDQQNIVGSKCVTAAKANGWTVGSVTSDAFDWAEGDEASFDLVLANLFLHHFTAPMLQRLFQALSRKTLALVAIDPARDSLTLAMTRLLWVIGCNKVTRHDAALSVRAGFSSKELSALWGQAATWRLREYAAGLSSHVFATSRR